MFANDIIKDNKEFLLEMVNAVGTDNFERLWNIISEHKQQTISELYFLQSEERNGDVN